MRYMLPVVEFKGEAECMRCRYHFYSFYDSSFVCKITMRQLRDCGCSLSCPLIKIEEVPQVDPNTWPDFIENAKVEEK